MLSKYKFFLFRAMLIGLTLFTCSVHVTEEYSGSFKARLEQVKARAEQGDLKAQVMLGFMYSYGIVVDDEKKVLKNKTEALRWYRLAAKQGHVEAQFNLGLMYEKGEGMPEDHAKAVSWFRQAAEQGYADAQSKLGSMYYDGKGVPKDYAEAMRWYRQAAEQGDVGAQSLLGLMYGMGEGVPQNSVQAYAWLSIAAAQGNEPAEGAKGELAKQMTSGQIAEAQELSRKYWEAFGPNQQDQ